MTCNCIKKVKIDETLYIDPLNKMEHTKKCIIDEIEYLKTKFSIDEIHKSGKTIGKRINELENLIWCKQEWVDIHTIAHQIIKTTKKTIVDMSHICKLEKYHKGQCICFCSLCRDKIGGK